MSTTSPPPRKRRRRVGLVTVLCLITLIVTVPAIREIVVNIIATAVGLFLAAIVLTGAGRNPRRR